MKNRAINPDVFSYSTAISACGKGGQWKSAVNLLREMVERGIQPNNISYSAAISACRRRPQWENAVNLLREMAERGTKQHQLQCSNQCMREETSVRMPSISCEKWQNEESNQTISAIVQQSVHARGEVSGRMPSISACGRGGQWESAVNLLREMAERGIKPNVFSYSSAINACGTTANGKRPLLSFKR